MIGAAPSSRSISAGASPPRAKSCVKAREVGQRDPEPAEADGEADRRLLRQRDLRASAMEPGEERRRTDVGEKLDRRQIERHLQRLPRGHRALIAEVEILRRVRPVAHRPVEQHRLRMRKALLERERVDEGLERRARRARRTRHVDGAVARSVLVIRGADARANLAGPIVDDHDRRRQFGAEPRDALPGERFQLRLQARVDREADHFRLFVRGDRLLRRMGGEFGEGFARLRDRLSLGGSHVVGADDPARSDPFEYAVPGRARGLAKTVGPPRLRRLRQRHEQRRLADRELQRLLAEIGERGRPHPLEITPERRDGEVPVEHAGLADRTLDLKRAGDLPQLCRQRAFRARLDETGDLHAERRPAGNDPFAPQPLSGGAQERARIDAMVLIEASVLVADQHREIARIDVMRRRRKPPAPVRQREGPQQPAVAIDDDSRAFARRHKIDRPEARDVAGPGDHRGGACG